MTTDYTRPDVQALEREAAFDIRLKSGARFLVAENGRILYDGDRNMGPFSEEWRIIGFTTRHNARRLITLQEAADGMPIGQGWVHDLDHGTHRMWAMPLYRRAVRVIRKAA